MSNRRFLCASPKYLEKHGAPERVEDLAGHRCIIHRQNDDTYGVWRYIVNDHIEAIKPLIPLKRAADPDEIAGLVAYLARKESGYMTGSSLTIDGGMAL